MNPIEPRGQKLVTPLFYFSKDTKKKKYYLKTSLYIKKFFLKVLLILNFRMFRSSNNYIIDTDVLVKI